MIKGRTFYLHKTTKPGGPMAPRGMTPERAERANQVMLMRGDALPFREIAKRLGISPSVAHDDYRRAIRDTYRASTEELVSTQHQRLESIFTSFIEATKEGDAESANVCLKAVDQINKLFGLNSAVKLDVQGGASDQFAEFLNTLRKPGDE